jgi:amidohydrolase
MTSRPDANAPASTRLAGAKSAVVAAVDAMASTLIEASQAIHTCPELAYEEHHAHDLLTSIVQDRGVDTERGAFGLSTSFRASSGSGGPTIAVLAEYDALPDIGHACGHNIIGTAAVGAFLAASAVVGELGGTVVLLGSPAEEGGAGKIVMAGRGAFEGIDAAMMVHPAGLDLVRMDTIAVQQLWARYQGAAAHAAAAPWMGRNALDAAVLGYANVAALRQHIMPTERVHGIFTHGGERPNIVPAFAETYWYVRSPTMRSLESLKPRVLAAVEAGAAATGCTCTHQWVDNPYSDMIDNPVMLGSYVDNASTLGRDVVDPRAIGAAVVGSTDMGNVSYLVPSIHPMIKVAPANVAIHTEEFARWTASEHGDRAVLDGAKAMAMTIVDLLGVPGALDDARASWEAELAARTAG